MAWAEQWAKEDVKVDWQRLAGTHVITGDGRELGEPIPDLSEP
jgi:hypothetical protein